MTMSRRQGLLDLGDVLSGSPRPETLHRLRQEKNALTHLTAAALRHQCRGAAWQALCAAGVCAPLPAPLRARLPAGHPAVTLEDGWMYETHHAGVLTAQTREIIASLNHAGLVPMLLKGMALTYGWQIIDPGQRWMVDIDLMVRPEDLATAIAVLDGLGYCHKAPLGAPHHVPAVSRSAGEGEVELHFAPVIPSLQAALPTETLWNNAIRCTRDGLFFYIPALADALLHTALHAQETGHVRALARIPVRALIDFSRLWQTADAPVDWITLRQRAAAAGVVQGFDIHLYQTCMLLNRPWPIPRAPSLRARLHWALCLAAYARPDSVGRLLQTRYEIWQVLREVAPGRPLPVRLSAGLIRCLQILCKYRWRLWNRLLGKHP